VRKAPAGNTLVVEGTWSEEALILGGRRSRSSRTKSGTPFPTEGSSVTKGVGTSRGRRILRVNLKADVPPGQESREARHSAGVLGENQRRPEAPPSHCRSCKGRRKHGTGARKCAWGRLTLQRTNTLAEGSARKSGPVVDRAGTGWRKKTLRAGCDRVLFTRLGRRSLG